MAITVKKAAVGDLPNRHDENTRADTSTGTG